MATRLWFDEFVVNTTAGGLQFSPSVAGLADGGFAIAWVDDNANDTVRWQRFDAGGSFVGAENIVVATGQQTSPDVVQLGDGNIWIVQKDEDSTGFDISGQVFSPAGGLIRAQDPSTVLVHQLFRPAVASLGPFGSVAVWEDRDINGNDVFIQYFTTSGTKAPGFRLNTNATTLSLFQGDAEVAVSPGHGLVAAVWTDLGVGINGGVIGRILNSSGAGIAGEFLISAAGSGFVQNPQVKWLDNGKFVVVWEQLGGDGSDFGIRFAIHSASGAVVFSEHGVNTVTAGSQTEADVTTLADGGFAVVWVDSLGSGGDFSGTSIKLQAFNTDGTKRGSEILVNTSADQNQSEPSLDTLSDGRLIVTWRDDSVGGAVGDASVIRAQIVDPREGTVNGNDQANTLYGHDVAGDIISGLGADDVLIGLGGSDELFGGFGDDTLSGGTGGDVLNGGNGTDTADYRSSASGQVNISLLADTASGGDALGDSLDFIENLIGSRTLRDILIGNNGTNTIAGLGGNDSLRGEGGDDLLEGGAGADALNGGAGTADYAIYRNSNSGIANVNLLLGTGSGGEAEGDVLFFIENLHGSLTRRDILIGNDLDNRIFGNGGNDSIRGEGGADVIIGGAGADSLNGGAGNDIVDYFASQAGVTVDLSVATQVSGGDASGDTLLFFEQVFGSLFDDVLKGSATANSLVGLNGMDTLNGREGSDYLFGGADADTFRFDVSNLGVDTIVDWQDGVDKISIGALVETSLAGLTFQDQGTTRVIIRGLNGTGAIAVESSTAFTLDAGDFVFV